MISLAQTALGVSGVKFLSSRFGAIGRLCLLSVVLTNLRLGFAVQTEIAHQSTNPTNAVMVTLLSEFNLNPGRSIAPFVLAMYILNEQFEAFILGFPR